MITWLTTLLYVGDIGSVEELKRITGVSDQQLDTEIDEKDFYMLGENIDSVTGLLERLNLTLAKQADVRRTVDREGTQAGVAHALRLWHGVNPSRATYRALVEILLILRKGDSARLVCNFMVTGYTLYN